MPMMRVAAQDALLTNIRGDITHLYICTQEPTTHTEATSTYACGNKAGPSLGAIGARSPNGREFEVEAITDGNVTATLTATHWALTDNTGNALLAAGELDTSQSVTSDNLFTLTAFPVAVPDPVSV